MPMPAALSLLLAVLPAPQDPPAAAPAAVVWQRTLADALWLQQRTGKPLLLAVNMDGEVFCERFANEVYGRPDFAELAMGYVCLVASPDRHNDMDYDGLGRRIECPRFPGVTCSEHQNVEPELFARWFRGQRAAPRHVGVDRDGKVLFDRFLASSIDDHLDDIRRHAGRPGDEPLPADPLQLLALRDARARRAVEGAWRDGSKGRRLELLAAAGKAQSGPFDLLRLGLRDEDEEVFAAAAGALAATATADAAIDLQDALARAGTEALRAILLEAWAGLAKGGGEPALAFSRHQAAVDGIAAGRGSPAAKLLAGAAPAAAAPGREALEQALDRAELAAKARPEDGEALLEVAAANLALAEFYAAAGDKLAALLFEDSRRALARAEPHVAAAKAPALAASKAIVHFQLGDDGDALASGRQLHLALAELGEAAALDAGLLARALRAEAKAAAAHAYEAVRDDGNAKVEASLGQGALAFAALGGSPWATAQDLLDGAGLLEFAGARRQAQELLLAAVKLDPAGPAVHERLRARLIGDFGGEGCRRRYGALVEAAADQPTMAWFAGYAAIVAAELHVRDKRPDAAAAAYDDCLARMQASAGGNAGYADSANHFAVLALVGRALLRYGKGDAEAAVADLAAAKALRPASWTEPDGLGRKGAAVADRLERELRQAGKVELADRLAVLRG